MNTVPTYEAKNKLNLEQNLKSLEPLLKKKTA